MSETRVFTLVTIVVGVVVVAVVGYAISQQPSIPSRSRPRKHSSQRRTGTSFSGTVGTLNDQHKVEGIVPFSFETYFQQKEKPRVHRHPAEMFVR